MMAFTSKDAMFFLWLSLLSGSAFAQYGISINVAPVNKAVLQGQASINFTCRVNQSEFLDSSGQVEFAEFITRSTGRLISVDEDLFYFGGDLDRRLRYGTTKDAQDRFSLKISSPELMDGGKYACSARNDDGVTRSAELIVIEQKPICDDDITGDLMVHDVVTLTCVLTSQGRWMPSVAWNFSRIVESLNKTSRSEVLSEGTNRARVTYTASFQITDADSQIDAVARIYFERPSHDVIDANEADNAPEFTYSHQFDPIVPQNGKRSTEMSTRTSRPPTSTSPMTTTASSAPQIVSSLQAVISMVFIIGVMTTFN